MTKRPDLRYERRLWKSGLEAIAGVDEAGVGPMAGPVVAAAVIFAPEAFIKGVHDSKQLTHERRETLYPLIRARALAVGVGLAGPGEIDELNIYWAAMLASEPMPMSISPSPVITSTRRFGCANARPSPIIAVPPIAPQR